MLSKSLPCVPSAMRACSAQPKKASEMMEFLIEGGGN
jgi:hypothetical protein